MKLQFASIIAIIAAIVAILSLTSCSKKGKVDPNKQTDTIAVNYLRAIEADEGITVNFKQADGKPMVTVTCHKKFAKSLNVRVEDGILKTNYKPNSQILDNGVVVNVTAPSLENVISRDGAEVIFGEELKIDGDFKITTTDAGSVRFKTFTCANLTLDASNASLIRFDKLTCANLKATATNCATILLKGDAANYTLNEGTVSEIRADELKGNGNRVKIDESALKQRPKDTPMPTKKDSTGNNAATSTTATPAAAPAVKKPAVNPAVKTSGQTAAGAKNESNPMD